MSNTQHSGLSSYTEQTIFSLSQSRLCVCQTTSFSQCFWQQENIHTHDFANGLSVFCHPPRKVVFCACLTEIGVYIFVTNQQHGCLWEIGIIISKRMSSVQDGSTYETFTCGSIYWGFLLFTDVDRRFKALLRYSALIFVLGLVFYEYGIDKNRTMSWVYFYMCTFLCQ